MKILEIGKLDLSGLKFANPEDSKKTSAQWMVEAFDSMIEGYMSAQQKALKEDRRRIWYKIMTKLELAAKEGSSEVQFEDAEWDFIMIVKRDCELKPAKILQRVEDLIIKADKAE